jgi:hypothetical protein
MDRAMAAALAPAAIPILAVIPAVVVPVVAIQVVDLAAPVVVGVAAATELPHR